MEEKRDELAAAESSEPTIVEPVSDTKFPSGKDLTKLLPTWYVSIEANNVKAIENISKLESTFIDLVRSMDMEDHEAVNQPIVESQMV